MRHIKTYSILLFAFFLPANSKHVMSFIIFLFLLASGSLLAQNIADKDPTWRADSAGIHQKIDSIFMNLDKSKLTTGFLFERIAMPLSGMQNYSGHTDSIINANRWHQLYFELKHYAEITPSTLPTSHDLVKRVENSLADNIIPLGIINIDINRIKTIALDSGLLYIQGEQLFENPSNTQLPYEVKRIFAISPLNNDPLRTRTTFLIDSSFYFSNIPLPILHFEINFGDGVGFRTVHFGEKITVNYTKLESVIIISKSFISTDTLQSKSLAFVVNNISVQNKSGGSGVHDCSDFHIPMDSEGETDYFGPDAVWPVYVHDDFQAETGVVFLPPRTTPILAGRAYIKYGCQNTTGKLIKPFIFVDGIDFGTNCLTCPDKPYDDEGLRYGDRGWRQLLMGKGWDEDKKETDEHTIKGVVKLMKKLCSEGYDLVILDPKDGADDIRFNAFALIDLINLVNAELILNNSKNQIVVCGASMGGQQTRYALRNMERRGLNHNTRLYIAFDSPHRGANIPLGTQYAIRFASFYLAPTNLPKVGVYGLFAPASQQLLKYHYIPSEEFTKDALPSQKHIDFFYNDPNMIDFPQKPRLVAITNGSGFGKEQGTDGVSYKPGDLTLHIYTGRWFIARAVGDKYNGPNEVTVFWGSYVQSTVVFEMVVEWLTNWLGEWFSNIVTWVVKTVQVLTTDVIEMKNTLPLDNTSGGWRNTNEFFAKGLLFNAHAEAGRYNHSFIPTYSAMGIDLSQIPNEDITVPINTIMNTSAFPVYNSAKSPFHAIYAPHDNYEHITVSDGSDNNNDNNNIQWIMNEVSPPDLFLQNRPLSNPIVNNIPPLNGYGYEARNTITIGKNVTNTFPFGDFIVDGNGNTGAIVDIGAGQKITIKDGTWFKPGSKVYLFIKPFACQNE